MKDTLRDVHTGAHPRFSSGWDRLTTSIVGQQVLIACVTIVLLAWSVVTQPPFVSIAVTGFVALAGLVAFLRGTYVRSFLLALGALLTGYAFFGRGFAHLGVAPVYVGEIVLLLGGAALMVYPGATKRLLGSSTMWLITAFALIGMLHTLPYVSAFGIDAFRDGVSWGYAFFAVLVASLLSRPGHAALVLNAYARVVPWFLFWIPVARLLMRFGADYIPQTAPGVSLIALKSGDIGVHLAGSLAFLMLRPALMGATNPRLVARLEPLLWLAWFVAFALTFNNRGAIITVLVSAAALFLLRPTTRWTKPLLLGLAAAAVFAMAEVEIPLTATRSISIQSLSAAVTSLVSDTGEGQYDGTRRWRLNWWTDIVSYTVLGEYFWTGKGFGINLANDDGYQVHDDDSLRSPHNAHMTVLARSGVPGAILWLLLLATFAWDLLRGIAISNRRGDPQLAALMLWTLIYWLAFIVNANFDVFLEGPQGGIWFWCVIGFGIALTQLAKRRAYETVTRR